MLNNRVLVIDDEKNIRRTLGLVLEGEGYEVRAVGTAEDGIRLLETEGADLIILDIKLPGMSGVEALQLRLQNQGFDLPYELFLALPYVVTIIALTIAGRNASVPSAMLKPYRRE